MAQIIRGTTPTIEFRFKEVPVDTINTAVLTIRQNGTVVIEKHKRTADVGKDTISWKLTQQDTLALNLGASRIMVNWLTADGTRGASNQYVVEVLPNKWNEVILHD